MRVGCLLSTYRGRCHYYDYIRTTLLRSLLNEGGADLALTMLKCVTVKPKGSGNRLFTPWPNDISSPRQVRVRVAVRVTG